MNTNYFDVIINNIVLVVCSTVIYLKISNYKKAKWKEYLLISITIIICTAMYIICRNTFDTLFSHLLLWILQTVLLRFITKSNMSDALIGVIIANLTTTVVGVISVLLEFFVQTSFNISNTSVNVVITDLLELLLVYFVLKIKRIKNGLSFFNNQNQLIKIVIIDIGLTALFIYGVMSYRNDMIYQYIGFYYIVLGVLLFLIIQETIVLYYKQKLEDKAVIDYKVQLEQKDAEIKRLTEEAFKVSKINHEFYNRQKSLEKMVKEKMLNLNMEAAEELEILDRIKEVTNEHSEKMKEIKTLSQLPTTEIKEIDDMFSYMQHECAENKIQFKLKVNGNIHYMINNLIQKNKLETLIGDHLRDAIIAINSSNNTNKEIFTIIGTKDDIYELCIFDTGIEFETNTLLKLGLEPATTHKDTGGTGIGFITTFETLKECKASIEIEEKGTVSDTDYTKAVKFIFDGKSEYRIKSYRSDKLQSTIKDERIKITSLNS